MEKHKKTKHGIARQVLLDKIEQLKTELGILNGFINTSKTESVSISKENHQPKNKFS